MKIEIKCTCGATFWADTGTIDFYVVAIQDTAIHLTARGFIEAHKSCCTVIEK